MDLNTLPIHIPVGESILNGYHVLAYPELLKYKNIILETTKENIGKTYVKLIEDERNIALILCVAAELGNIELVKLICGKTNDKNIINQVRTCASLNNNPESLNIVKYLTETFRLEFSQALLYNAAHSNNLEIIDYLYLKYYAEMSNYSTIYSVYKTASVKGSIETIEILLDILRNTPQPSIDTISNSPKWIGRELKKNLDEKTEYFDNLKKINEQKKLDEEQKQIQETFQKALEKSQSDINYIKMEDSIDSEEDSINSSEFDD